MAARSKKKKFQSIGTSLEEARFMFEYELGRFRDIESKATSFLTLNSIIFAGINLWSLQNLLLFMPTNLFLVISIINAFQVFSIRPSKRPHKNYSNFFKNARMPKKKNQEQLLLNYRVSLEEEEKINDEKMEYLTSMISMSKIAWILFGLTLLFLMI